MIYNVLKSKEPGNFQWILEKLRQEVVFTAAMVLAVITSCISFPKLQYIDFKVLASLFNLMIVIAAFEKLRILDIAAIKILRRYSNARTVSFILIGLTYIAAMFITNDVALITFVPITIITARKAGFNPVNTVIFQTLAANIGSSLTPMGNPQNLYLFSYFNITTLEFFSTMTIFVILGFVWLFLLNKKIPSLSLNFSLRDLLIEDKKRVAAYIILFMLIILSILRVIDYRMVTIITVIAAVAMDRDIFKNIDYLLLLTFIFFFIIIGNLSSLKIMNYYLGGLLRDKYSAYYTSLLTSQFISNVPAAILLSGFTSQWKSVLLGVDIGGMGTLIASLASVISYKLYIKEYGNRGYLVKFHIYNFLSLLIFATFMLIFL